MTRVIARPVLTPSLHGASRVLSVILISDQLTRDGHKNLNSQLFLSELFNQKEVKARPRYLYSDSGWRLAWTGTFYKAYFKRRRWEQFAVSVRQAQDGLRIVTREGISTATLPQSARVKLVEQAASRARAVQRRADTKI